MEYNQEKVDEIRDMLPFEMRKQVYMNINKGKSKDGHISYSTVCDVLKTYRDSKPRYLRRRTKVYDECVKLLTEKGIPLSFLND
jgi:hypothetical protein